MVLLSTLMLSACAATPVQVPTLAPDLRIAVAVSVAQTQAAATLTAIPSSTPVELTPTPAPPTATPLPTLTPTMAGVWLTLNQAANCWMGPGAAYDWKRELAPGTLVEAMAVSKDGEYYYVRDPDTFSEFCWLKKNNLSVTGNYGALAVFTPQPTPTLRISLTPTPAPVDFNVRYEKMISCSGNYALVLYIENTSRVIWKSVYVSINDATTKKNFYHISDLFRGTTEDTCILDIPNALEDLVDGEGSMVACVNPGQFNYDPTGNTLTVNVTLYDADGRRGNSLTKTFTVTP